MTYINWAAGSRPMVFGHRGGSRLAPENTLAAFDRGVLEGVDGIELDLRLTKDGEMVACHDATLDRTTDATGPVSRFTARELAGVDAGYRFQTSSGATPFRGRGIRLPTLREVIDRFPRHALIVELKDDEVELATGAVKLVQEAGAVQRVCIGSFRHSVLQVVRRLDPRLITGAARREVRLALYASWFGLFPCRVPYGALQVPEHREGHHVVSPRFIRKAHRAGVPVHVWIVDEPGAIRRLLGWGADGIITDRPDVAVPTVAAWLGGAKA